MRIQFLPENSVTMGNRESRLATPSIVPRKGLVLLVTWVILSSPLRRDRFWGWKVWKGGRRQWRLEIVIYSRVAGDGGSGGGEESTDNGFGLMAALSQSITSFIFAKEYGLHTDVFSTAVILRMIVSLPVLVAYYGILEFLH
ncbi:hypothetical protein F0562_031140 [Nyssa sinensis]|uniref:Uncharacterized protein n=1 Tax=Nyssa sinensis TaxID=561372 RepID=A0A5J5AUA0_9ASTE|nr:hypothetical protein F0562_031140 [Nyssa sinensis]